MARILRGVFLALLLCVPLLRCANGVMNWAVSSLTFAGIKSFSVLSDSVTLGWDPVSSAESYAVLDVTSSLQLNRGTAAAGASSFTVTGLSSGTTYRFRVRALDSNGIADSNTNDVEVTTAVSAGLADLPVVSGLKLWLRSDVGLSLPDGNHVATWADQSDAAHDFTQTAPLAQPTWSTGVVNHRPALAFNTATSLTTPTLELAQESNTLFLVFYGLTSGTRILIGGPGSGNPLFGMGPTDKLGIHKGSGGTFLESDKQVDPSKFYVATYSSLVSGANLTAQIFLNGAPANSTLTLTGVAVGGGTKLGGFAGQAFSGYLVEVLVYSGQLPVGEQTAVEAYLMNRYAL